jgi:UDP-N-acetylglucosamine 3-dehydrogenase
VERDCLKKVRLGLIGLGYIGKIHLRSCLSLKSAELVAVSDISRKALNFAKRLGVKKTYTEYQQLLKDDSIDAVIIALPTHLHLSCAKDVAESGKHMLLEKPLARNVKEGEEIVSVANSNNVRLMVGYSVRFSPEFQSLKDRIESGELGDVQTGYATNITSGPFFHRAEDDAPCPVPDWWFNKELTGGGALIDLGCHMLNLMRWYMGEISDIRSLFGFRFNLEVEDQATCLLEFTSGQSAIVNVGWFSQQSQLRVDLFGTVAHSSVSHNAPSKALTAFKLMLRRFPPFFLPHRRELMHFLECVREDTRPLTSGEDALKDLEAISRAYKNELAFGKTS